MVEEYVKFDKTKVSRYDEIVDDLENRRDRREKGLYNGIPISFERYREYFSSIDKGMYTGILAGTGVGKSRLARKMFVYDILDFSIKNNYPVKILYFALEDSWKSIYKKIIIHYLYERHDITLHPKYLDSKEIPLDKRYIDIIKKDKEFFSVFEESVFIINDKTSPYEIFDTCKKAHIKYGKDNHIIAIIDNYSNVTKDRHHLTEWDAIRELSRNHVRLELCKNMEMSVVAILQQDLDTEKHSSRNSGKLGIASIEPSLGSVGDNKVVVKDLHTMFALFNPWRYEIKSYPYAEGYNIDVLRNRFRSLLNLKTNEGEMAPRLGLYFDGLHEIYTEMPLTIEKEELERMYNKILQEERERKERFANRTLFR